jgi:hypothetical protein
MISTFINSEVLAEGIWTLLLFEHIHRVSSRSRVTPSLEKAAVSGNRAGEGERWGTPRRLCELKNIAVFF